MLPPPSQALPPGTMVDAYRIDDVIGCGGFGVTYRGLDTKLDQAVAIKEYFPSHLAVRRGDAPTIAPRTQGESEAYAYGLERFLREARTLAQFRSPNIVRVNNYVEANNSAYLVMDYEDGQPLSTLLGRVGRVNDRQAYALAVHLLRGLCELHDRDCLHRDIKPANIFVRRQGAPLLLDFGSARFALEQRTGTLTVMYTPGYAPIEQYGGSEVQGPWSDLYAIGATLFHCVTGDPPCASVERVSALHAGQPDPLGSGFAAIRDSVRPTLAVAIEHMLASRREDRPASARTVLQQLDASTAAPPSTAGSMAPTYVAPHRPATATESSASLATRGVTTGMPSALDESDVEMIGVALARHLGPIARVLARRAASAGGTRDDVRERLSGELDDAEERAEFMHDTRKAR